jgi:hypothetical protein
MEKQEATIIAKRYSLKIAEAQELINLLSEMRFLNFSNSGDLSDYIIENKLGYKYPNISGILTMTRGEDKWHFKGGFPKHIFKIICKELNLKHRESDAKPGNFTSFNDIDNPPSLPPYPIDIDF